jgi:hypothetical protein
MAIKVIPCFGFAPYGMPGQKDARPRVIAGSEAGGRGWDAKTIYLLLRQAALADGFFTCFVIDHA